MLLSAKGVDKSYAMQKDFVGEIALTMCAFNYPAAFAPMMAAQGIKMKTNNDSVEIACALLRFNGDSDHLKYTKPDGSSVLSIATEMENQPLIDFLF